MSLIALIILVAKFYVKMVFTPEQQKFMIESYFGNGHTVHTFRESDSVQRKPGNLRFVLKKILPLFNVKWKTTANYLSGNCCSTLS
jgi:hypothetical protein